MKSKMQHPLASIGRKRLREKTWKERGKSVAVYHHSKTVSTNNNESLSPKKTSGLTSKILKIRKREAWRDKGGESEGSCYRTQGHR